MNLYKANLSVCLLSNLEYLVRINLESQEFFSREIKLIIQ